METKVIAKTLLTIWPGLADYERMLADRAQTHALCSFHTPLLTARTMDKIIDLNVKRQTIHTLRVGLDQLINRLDPGLQTVVRHYYRDLAPTPRTAILAQQLHLSERSLFRRLHAATAYVAQHLPDLQINFFTWQYLLQHHAWIKETFTRQLQPHHRRSN